MYYSYIIYSKSTDKFYYGYTSDIEERIRRHNNGENLSTKHGLPWIVVYYSEHEEKTDAMKEEKRWKNIRSRVKVLDRIKKKSESNKGIIVEKILLYSLG
jgi:putative endonuclease